MLTALNRQLFEATVFDNGALGLGTSVVHRFAVAGVYEAAVRKDGKHVGNVTFEVWDDAATMQLDIDLAMAERGMNAGRQSVSSKGYVVFHATSDTGWSVHICDGGQAIFESTHLTSGDMFALALLEPGRYRIENKLGSASGSVEVRFTKDDVRRLIDLKPVVVNVGKSFGPQHVKLIATQGLVFRIEDDARIVITRQNKGGAEPKRGATRFPRLPISSSRTARKAH